MGRRPKPEQQLHIAALHITAGEVIIRDRLKTAAWLAYPLTGTEPDGSRPTGITNPVPQQAATISRYLETINNIADYCDTLAHYSMLLTRALGEVPSSIDTARIAAQHRCSGGRPSVEPWTRPECTNIVGEHSTTGLCDACRKRRDRWNGDQQMSA